MNASLIIFFTLLALADSTGVDRDHSCVDFKELSMRCSRGKMGNLDSHDANVMAILETCCIVQHSTRLEFAAMYPVDCHKTTVPDWDTPLEVERIVGRLRHSEPNNKLHVYTVFSDVHTKVQSLCTAMQNHNVLAKMSTDAKSYLERAQEVNHHINETVQSTHSNVTKLADTVTTVKENLQAVSATLSDAVTTLTNVSGTLDAVSDTVNTTRSAVNGLDLIVRGLETRVWIIAGAIISLLVILISMCWMSKRGGTTIVTAPANQPLTVQSLLDALQKINYETDFEIAEGIYKNPAATRLGKLLERNRVVVAGALEEVNATPGPAPVRVTRKRAN